MAGNAPEPTDDKKLQRKKTYAFQLTPEEQELAYELKAGMMRKLESQNAQLRTELQLQQRMQDQISAGKRLARPAVYDNLSHSNAIKLVKLYERKNKEGSERLKQVERELAQATQLAQRFRSLLQAERGDCYSTPTSAGSRATLSQGKGLCSDAEDELDDDEAIFKRHVGRLAATKSMITTTPIRVQDIIRKNEVILIDNEALRLDIARLKEDNASLLLQTKHADAHKDRLLHLIATSEADRKELVKRLAKEQKQYRVLQSSLSRQASDWIQERRLEQLHHEQEKWMSVNRMDVLGAEERTYCHHAKKNVFMPRKMYPVEQYVTGAK